MTRDEKLERIKSRQWYHSIDVEDGLVTPGAHSLAELRHTLERLQLAARLDGLSVLDIGAWDGYFSFEAERRGARGSSPTTCRGDRVVYRAVKQDGVSEYLQETYEGLFVKGADGIVRNTYPRTRPLHTASRVDGDEIR